MFLFMIDLYKKYHSSREYTQIGLFREIKTKYNSKKVLYPGCYVHITPSLIFPFVVYVDSFRNTNKFYESLELKSFIEENREYSENFYFQFHHQDYTKNLPEELEFFDLVISQYGGFIGQAVKKYLKKGGLLVCNNSHGDASMASLDDEYEFIAVYNRKSDDSFTISEDSLDKYFIPKKKTDVSKELIKKMMKGISYTKSPTGYIFRKK